MPDVSVVIPTRNRPELTVEAVRSALAQEGVALEIIVVDDSSDDDTPDRVRRLDGRVVLLRQDRRGACAARNLGMDRATGRYLKFLDSDDLLAPDSLREQVRVLEETGADVCYGDWEYIGNLADPRVGGRPKRVMGATRDPITDLLGDWWVSPFGYLHRAGGPRQVRWDEALGCLQDFDFILRRACAGAVFAYWPGLTGYYRMHAGGQITESGARAVAENRCRVLDKATALLRPAGQLTPERAQRLAEHYWIAARAFYRCDRPAFESCLRKIEELCPGFRPRGGGAAARVTRWLGIRWAERVLAAGRAGLRPVRRNRLRLRRPTSEG